jgi:oxygen-independent coproporphyrinogen III oxidase
VLLYFHVPFCGRRCSYCDFSIAVRRHTPSDAWLEAVLHEWAGLQVHPVWRESPEVETIYFGGGTPSRLEPGVLRRLIAAIRSDRPVVAGAEVTLEANPEDVAGSRVEGWLDAGITRISLGAQSFDAAVLAWMHREHTPARTLEAVRVLRSGGIQNLSLDLIYALPGAMGTVWDRDLAQALALEPEHLSLYALTVEEGTPLGKWTARGIVEPSPDEAAAGQYLHAHTALGAAGYQHYEVSNAARPGFRAVHNSGYWRRAAFLGLGPSAHSGHGRHRWWNRRAWEEYRRVVTEGGDPVEGREELADSQQLLEERYLGLRTDAGVAAGLVPEPLRRQWVREGWASDEGERVRLTAEGWLRLDALVASLPTGS